jgi:hypothetical protein
MQPLAIRIALWSNILFWSFSLPGVGGLPQIHLVITLMAALMVKGRFVQLPQPLLIALGLVSSYGVAVFLTGPCQSDLFRVLSSIALLNIACMAVWRLISTIDIRRHLLPRNEVAMILIIVTGCVVLDYLFQTFTGAANDRLRVGGLYAEPSHLAISVSPLIFYLWHSVQRQHKIIAACTSFFLLLASFSTTLLLLLICLFSVAKFRMFFASKHKIEALVGLAVIVAAGAFFLASPLAEETLLRVNDIADLREDSNLSSLVYANGWQTLAVQLEASNGAGIGFNAMGCEPRVNTEIGTWLELIGLEEQNAKDGSFILSKIGSELGLAGLSAWLIFIIFSLRLPLTPASDITSDNRLLIFSLLVSVALGGLIRGAGYFGGSILMAGFALGLAFRLKQGRLAVEQTKLGVAGLPIGGKQ